MPYTNVADFLILNTNRYPQKTAIVFKEKRVTYKELNQRVNSLANGLLKMGVVPGDKVGYLLPNSIQLIEVYYALQKIGAVAVPLNFRVIPREIHYLVSSSECKVLIFAGAFEDKVKEIKEDLESVELFICTQETRPDTNTLSKVAAMGSSNEPPLFQDKKRLSRIQFTGGTTGMPKGVMRTHQADIAEIVGVMASNGVSTNPDEVVLIQCPLEHHGGHSWFTSALAAGATVVICDYFQAEEILQIIQREKVTYLMLLPPSTYFSLIECPALAKYDLSSVKLVQSAAGAASDIIIKRIHEAFPCCCFNYGWGQTESGLGTSLVLTPEMVENDLPERRSVGKPMPFIELKIVDQNDQPLGEGLAGECLTRSPAGMSGYYNQPGITGTTITSEGWIRTGDIMMKDDKGYFYLLSRKKDMIKSGGENVFAKEVEDVIRRHPSVRECVVFGIPDKLMGEAVMAVVLLKEGEAMNLEELQAHCKTLISSYKKPRYADFVYSFPMNEAGKIQKYKLIEMYKDKYSIKTI